MSTGRVVWRLAIGRPLDGREYVTRQVAASGWRRAAWRLAVLVVAACSWGAWRYPAAAYTVLGAVLAVVAVLVLVLARRQQSRRFVATYVRPARGAISLALQARVDLAVDPALGGLIPRMARPLSPLEQRIRAAYGVVLEPVLRWPGDQLQRARWAVGRTRVATWVRRPREDRSGCITLVCHTPYVTADHRSLISSIIHAKIPVADLVERWDQVGTRVTARWVPRRRPPEGVGLGELQDQLPKLGDGAFYIGQAAGGEPVVVDLADDAPHIGISAQTGAGKSVLAQLIAVQVLRAGGSVIILDRKGSHRWARNLSGVTYCLRPEQMHEALVNAGGIADRRNVAAFDADTEPTDPRILIIVEELNGTIGQLKSYWASVRGKGDPKVSPAITALAEILYMGRTARVNVICIGQMLTARAVGGPEMRENLGVRCLARYSANAWKMLAPEAPMPRPSRVRGRWQVVVAGTAREVQVCYLTPAQAREVAGVHVSASVPDRPLTSNVHVDGGGNVDIADPLAEPITLQDGIDRDVVPWPLGATQKRLQRARRGGGRVPQPRGKRGWADLYAVGDLIEWVESERRKA